MPGISRIPRQSSGPVISAIHNTYLITDHGQYRVHAYDDNGQPWVVDGHQLVPAVPDGFINNGPLSLEQIARDHTTYEALPHHKFNKENDE